MSDTPQVTWDVEGGVYVVEVEDWAPVPVAEAYAIVHDIERYPEFLPDIQQAHWEGPNADIAVMIYKIGPVEMTVKTRMIAEPPTAIRYTLVEGPLKRLDGAWQFTAVPEGTRVSVHTAFEPQAASRWIVRMTKAMLEFKTRNLLRGFHERFRTVGAAGGA